MHSSDRRTVVAGTAGALPAVAAGAVPALPSPDAELIALARELEVFLPRYVPVLLENWRLGREAHALSRGRTSLEELGIAEEETGFTASDRIYVAMCSEADRLMNAVNAIPATSEAGFKAKFLAACLTNPWMLTDDPEELNFGEREVGKMIEATCAVLGISVTKHDDQDAAA